MKYCIYLSLLVDDSDDKIHNRQIPTFLWWSMRTKNYPCEALEQKESQNRMKNDRVMPISVQAQKWYLACFGH